MLNQLRLRYGLFWRGRVPNREELPVITQAIVTVLFLVVAYGIVGRLDYEAALVAEAQRQEARAEMNEAALVACLNGRPSGHYWEDSRGHRTYLVCRGTEEIPVGRVTE